MTFTQALLQLRAWCDQSQGRPIEIGPGLTGSFQTLGTFPEVAIQEIEAKLEASLQPEYAEFLAVIGESSLFNWSPYGGELYFYNPQRVIEVSRAWSEAWPEVERFCFVGEHRSMGDMMGFCTDRQGPRNFDVYCHEYPFEEYVGISDEIKSWREFGPYIIGVVETNGQQSL